MTDICSTWQLNLSLFNFWEFGLIYTLSQWTFPTGLHNSRRDVEMMNISSKSLQNSFVILKNAPIPAAGKLRHWLWSVFMLDIINKSNSVHCSIIYYYCPIIYLDCAQRAHRGSTAEASISLLLRACQGVENLHVQLLFSLCLDISYTAVYSVSLITDFCYSKM